MEPAIYRTSFRDLVLRLRLPQGLQAPIFMAARLHGELRSKQGCTDPSCRAIPDTASQHSGEATDKLELGGYWSKQVTLSYMELEALNRRSTGHQ